MGLKTTSVPPLLYHAPELTEKIYEAYENYLDSLSPDRSGLLKHFALTDIAMKVVGTGSVGTFCAVILLVGANDDCLILQVEEARQSVLEPYTAPSKFENSGQRIVVGQRYVSRLDWRSNKAAVLCSSVARREDVAQPGKMD